MSLENDIDLARQAALDDLLDTEDKLIVLQAEVEAKKLKFERLNRAYRALTGDDTQSSAGTIEVGAEAVAPKGTYPIEGTRIPEVRSQAEQVKAVSGPLAVTTHSVPPPPQRPICSGCGHPTLEMSEITLRSGKTVRVMKCMDSSCGNEQY